MTVLLFVKSYLTTKLNVPEVKFYFDNENPTNEEEILQENLEQVLIKVPQDVPVDISGIQDKEETIYLNGKSQVVKITPVERNGRMTELHQILSFDVEKLPQAQHHTYGTEEKKDGESTPKFLAPLPRVKVPVKDGMSQNKFIQNSKGKAGIVANPHEMYYTAEDVAQHASQDDCWTILNGRIYDVTEYAKVHPGGKKIFLGKGKDCTELYNKYHPWVNGQFLIGKYQVGVLKRSQ